MIHDLDDLAFRECVFAWLRACILTAYSPDDGTPPAAGVFHRYRLRARLYARSITAAVDTTHPHLTDSAP